MKHLFWAALLAQTATAATADPVTDAHFSIGVSVCLNFGTDAWFVEDRIEGAGWRGQYDADFGTKVFLSPDNEVILIPPPDDPKYPVWCSVLSPSVSLGFAENAVRSVLVKSQVDAIRGVQDGCRAFRTGMDQTIQVLNDGNAAMCDQPMSARVNVISDSDPMAGQ